MSSCPLQRLSSSCGGAQETNGIVEEATEEELMDAAARADRTGENSLGTTDEVSACHFLLRISERCLHLYFCNKQAVFSELTP